MHGCVTRGGYWGWSWWVVVLLVVGTGDGRGAWWCCSRWVLVMVAVGGGVTRGGYW
jgi:hypothetical protein